MSAHTPGPWAWDEDGWLVLGDVARVPREDRTYDDGEYVMRYGECGSHAAVLPNPVDKALIAAAPDLLAACVDALYAFGPREALTVPENIAIKTVAATRLRRAIAKAKGEPTP